MYNVMCKIMTLHKMPIKDSDLMRSIVNRLADINGNEQAQDIIHFYFRRCANEFLATRNYECLLKKNMVIGRY